MEFEESSPYKAVERKWDELREEIEDEMGYKVEGESGHDNNLMSDRNFIKSYEDEQPQVFTKF